MDLSKPDTWTDEDLDAAWTLLERHLPDGQATAIVTAEVARRAEVRLVRGEYGTHEPGWYGSCVYVGLRGGRYPSIEALRADGDDYDHTEAR